MTPIDEIKARLDLVSYIGRTVSLKKAGRTYKACCPFHNENTPSFVVDPDKGMWRCYGACATGGDLFAFVMKRNGWTFAEALRELAREAGVELKPQTPEQKQQADRLDKLRGLLKEAAAWYHARLLNGDAESAAALTYARERRGLTAATLEQFQIGYAPNAWTALADHLRQLGYTDDDLVATGLARRSDQGRVYDAFRWRLLIPIRDERGQVVGFGGRTLDPDEKAKYINSPQTALFDKSRILFGLDQAAPHIRRSETAVIVEGYMDAITAQQAGYANVVAQMGTALTEHQLKLIAPKWAKTIVLALDSDAAGQSATLRSLDVARQTLQADYAGRLAVEMRVLSIPDAKDPDDLIREHPAAWAELVANAIPVADFVIGVEAAALPVNASVQQREAVARRLLPILLASENDLYKKDNLQKLALKLRIPERDLLTWADEQIRILRAAPPKPRAADRPAERTAPPKPAAPSADGLPSPDELPPEPPDHDGVPDDFAPPDGDLLPIPALPRNDSAAAGRHPHEEYLLRMLYQDPQVFYEIGRKFYELAGGQGELVTGALCDLCADDFQDDHHRIFITVFRGALEQVEQDPSAYIRDQLGDLLTERLETLLIEEIDYTRDRFLRERMAGDFADAWRRHTTRGSYATLDKRAAIVLDALKLRHKRLARELDDERFLAADRAAAADHPLERLQQLLRARQLIETELNRLSRGGK